MTSRSIAISGATGGIGLALVRELAGPSVSLFLAGRQSERLDVARDIAERAGSAVTLCDVPLTDLALFSQQLLLFDDVYPIDLFVAAAGVKTGQVAGCEDARELDRVLDVNLRGPMHAVQAILPRMIARGNGQIAFFSSIAALSPHADLLSYSATKAGLRAYGAGLRQAVRGTGVAVSVISPGYIDTPMTDRHLGPTPQKISAERAARIIVRGLERRWAYITFPLALTFLVRLKAMLPVAIKDAIDSHHRARILPDRDEAGDL